MTRSLRTLVAGVATLDSNDPVLRSSLRLADRLGATLYVVHAFTRAEEFGASLGAAMDLAAQPEYEETVQEQLERSVSMAGGNTDRVTCRVIAGSAAAVLHRVAEEVGADMLVVGPTRHSRMSRAVLGTTAGRVIRQAHRPVLLLHRAAEDGAGPYVLLTTDLSAMSAATLQSGVESAHGLAGTAMPEIRCLWVTDHHDTGTPFRLAEHQILKHALDKVREFALKYLPDGSVVTPQVQFGDPAKQIVAQAQKWPADLVVLGTHGRSGLPRLLLGSVAESVLGRAACSVLVVPTQATAADQVTLQMGAPAEYAGV